ncbi:hypothetical protein V6582_21800 [Agrobacterium vitis]|uniref:hypothetical protein n=1 Tax=Agrobacterium vitis TaxID=373 RepID=UPI001F44C7C6|nr:hypothetical protein [Agrobacterium vitis]
MAKFLAPIAVVSWRIFFLTMSAREKPEAKPEIILTPTEIATLDSIDAARPTPRIQRRTLASYLLQIAMPVAISLASTIHLPETWSYGEA